MKLRNPELRAVTKAGYYAPDDPRVQPQLLFWSTPNDPQQEQKVKLADAVAATIPFDALGVNVGSVVRQPGTRTAELQVNLKWQNLKVQPTDDGKSVAHLTVVAASLNKYGDILASRLQTVTVIAHSQDPNNLSELSSEIPVMLRIPRKTNKVRVVVQENDGGRMGSAEVDRKGIDEAHESATPSTEPASPAGGVK